MQRTNLPLNIPNILSLYRIYSFPFIMIFVFLGHKDLFVFFICLSFLTDFLDGWIARHFNQVTRIGAALDSLADTGTYFLVAAGVIAFKWPDFKTYVFSISIFMALLLIADLFPWIKFGRFNSYHTYAAKAGGYIKGLFFIVVFTIGFFPWFYYFVIITGILAFIESIIISAILKESRADVKGLYWILKHPQIQDTL
jgi:cardiolipin synthase (CMP-forming)